MNTEITTAIINECRKFCAVEIRDAALEMDLAPDPQRMRQIWKKSIQMDLPGLPVPEIFSGGGASILECALVLETLAAECAGIASVFAHHYCACASLIAAGTDVQSKWLPKFTEPKNPPFIASLIMSFDNDNGSLLWREDKGHIVVNGRSPVFGNFLLADGFLVFASEDAHPENLFCVWLDKPATGMILKKPLQLPGLKMNSFGSILARDARISSDQVVADSTVTRKMLDAARAAFYGLTAALAMGAARTAYVKTLAYAKERYQFGKKIIFHQEIQRMLGDMYTKLAAGKALYREALESRGQAKPMVDAKHLSAKIFCTEAAMEIVQDAVQIHGGYGYMHDYGIEKIMRDVKMLQLFGGSNPLLKVRQTADFI